MATNPLGHQAVYTYDYRFGKVKTRQDPNHNPATNPNIIQYVYDPFGRIQMEMGPDACANGWTAYYLYNSFGTVGAQNVETRRTENCGVSGYIWKKAYFDGLGREIRTESEGSPDSLGNPRTVFSRTTYDLKGQVSKKCVPHFGLICTTEVTNEYYSVGRTVKTISPDDSPYNPTGESITETAYAMARTMSELSELRDAHEIMRFSSRAFFPPWQRTLSVIRQSTPTTTDSGKSRQGRTPITILQRIRT
ncbi:MAG: hypothetical protein AB2L11_08345 [Syntrophobacteraceae bacterium]